MDYVSTRGEAPARRFSQILLEGLAPDGGLYVPETLPAVKLDELRNKPYPELALAVLSRFMDDVPGLEGLVRATYTAKVFGSSDITPLRTLEPGLHLLALSNGPTLAFKDIALQLLGHLFEGASRKQKAEPEHPRRHLRRHRLGGRVRDARARSASRSSCSRRTGA